MPFLLRPETVWAADPIVDCFRLMLDVENANHEDGEVILPLTDSESLGCVLQFTIVGEAYVHGVMDGSYVPLDSEGKPMWSALTIV